MVAGIVTKNAKVILSRARVTRTHVDVKTHVTENHLFSVSVYDLRLLATSLNLNLFEKTFDIVRNRCGFFKLSSTSNFSIEIFLNLFFFRRRKKRKYFELYLTQRISLSCPIVFRRFQFNFVFSFSIIKTTQLHMEF